MAHEFFTWGNLVTWAICSVLIYLALNFRIYMIFHHPGRKLKAKARARRSSEARHHGYSPGSSVPQRERDCVQGATCFMGDDTVSGKTFRNR